MRTSFQTQEVLRAPENETSVLRFHETIEQKKYTSIAITTTSGNLRIVSLKVSRKTVQVSLRLVHFYIPSTQNQSQSSLIFESL
jgi:hypothetical protein